MEGTRQVHTCLIGPLCRAWPWNEYDDSAWEECDHGSCLEIVNGPHCPACFEEIARVYEEARAYTHGREPGGPAERRCGTCGGVLDHVHEVRR